MEMTSGKAHALFSTARNLNPQKKCLVMNRETPLELFGTSFWGLNGTGQNIEKRMPVAIRKEDVRPCIST